jgi:hypothetical protein
MSWINRSVTRVLVAVMIGLLLASSAKFAHSQGKPISAKSGLPYANFCYPVIGPGEICVTALPSNQMCVSLTGNNGAVMQCGTGSLPTPIGPPVSPPMIACQPINGADICTITGGVVGSCIALIGSAGGVSLQCQGIRSTQ